MSLFLHYPNFLAARDTLLKKVANINILNQTDTTVTKMRLLNEVPAKYLHSFKYPSVSLPFKYPSALYCLKCSSGSCAQVPQVSCK